MTVDQDSSSEAEASLAEQRARAELAKLELEADEIRDRLERSRHWYRGRFVLESIVGGTVAGALFVSWFLGVYQPRIEIEQQRLEFRLDAERRGWDLERRAKSDAINTHLVVRGVGGRDY